MLSRWKLVDCGLGMYIWVSTSSFGEEAHYWPSDFRKISVDGNPASMLTFTASDNNLRTS